MEHDLVSYNHTYSICLTEGAYCDKDFLEWAINEELFACAYYSALARLAPGRRQQEMIRNIARMKRDQKSRLMAVYFLITGSTYIECSPILPEGERPFCYQSALRDRFFAEMELAARYQCRMGETVDRCLKELYANLSDCASNTASQMTCLIEQLYQR